MNDQQFETLVGKLERQAQNQPGRYRRKVLLLALLGNAYVGAILLLGVALLVALIASIMLLKAFAVKLIIPLGVFLWMILKALWVKVDPPAGYEVDARQAPDLFALVDELRRRLRAPRFHHVLVTDEFNAGVVQSPRLAILGWHRNDLMIGLPLMKALTVEQFKAVLAHEFGHLSKGHGRMSNWIYRQRKRWSNLLAVLDARKSQGSFLFKPFLNWFAPYFNAYSFPLARANEYEADAASVRLTSPRAAAEALTGINVVASYLSERYWPQIYKQADEQPRPGFAPYFAMGQSVVSDVDKLSAEAWLERAMARQTDSADTHPALHDRLKAIGEPPRLALPAVAQTADHLLGGALEVVTAHFDRRWQNDVSSSWGEHYRQVQDGRRQLAELNGRFESGAELTGQEAYDRARLTETIGNNPDDALAQFKILHERVPNDAVICMSLGARLLSREDASGGALVERAMRLDESATAKGCELLRDYHWRIGGKEEARAWHQRLIERLRLQEAAHEERNQVLLRDKFVRHGLSDEALAELRDALKAIPGLRKAYFVRKRVSHFTHQPCYVLGFCVTPWFKLHRKRRAREVLRRIQESVHFPGETIILSVEGANYRFGRKFRWMHGARIL